LIDPKGLKMWGEEEEENKKRWGWKRGAGVGQMHLGHSMGIRSSASVVLENAREMRI
jgi:hypothetical protein